MATFFLPGSAPRMVVMAARMVSGANESGLPLVAILINRESNSRGRQLRSVGCGRCTLWGAATLLLNGRDARRAWRYFFTPGWIARQKANEYWASVGLRVSAKCISAPDVRPAGVVSVVCWMNKCSTQGNMPLQIPTSVRNCTSGHALQCCQVGCAKTPVPCRKVGLPAC